MNIWEILGIEPTDEIRLIRRAFAEKSRECHPEEEPEKFRVLQEAYRAAMRAARSQASSAQQTETTEEAEEKIKVQSAAGNRDALFREDPADCGLHVYRREVLQQVLAGLPDRLDGASFASFLKNEIVQIYLSDERMKDEIDHALAALKLKGNAAQLRVMCSQAQENGLHVLGEKIQKGERIRIAAAAAIMAAVFLLALAVTIQEYF